MKNFRKVNKRKLLFSIFLFFSTSFLSLKSFKNISIKNINIQGSELFSNKDLVENSSLNLPTRLIFIETKYLEKELTKNLSLKKVSIIRQILPFQLKVFITARTPVAFGTGIINGKATSGYFDDEGYFLYKKNFYKEGIKNFSIEIDGWEEKYRGRLSRVLASQKNDHVKFTKIVFSPNGFLTLEEKDLKTILLGLDPSLLESQLIIISNLKAQIQEKNFSKKIDNIDITDPTNPKIKVFKP